MGRAVRPMIEALLDGQRDKIVSAADAVRLIRPGDTGRRPGIAGAEFASPRVRT